MKEKLKKEKNHDFLPGMPKHLLDDALQFNQKV